MFYGSWDPFRDYDGLWRAFNRVFDDIAAERRMPLFRTSFLPGLSARRYPLVNVSEDGDAVHVEALAPGLDPDSLKISLTGDQLRIEGEKPGLSPDIKPEAQHRRERGAGRFVRVIGLPIEVEGNGIKAVYKNGLLTITLPKKEESKPKQIAVKVN